MNLYYSPEDFGLTLLGVIDWSDGNYVFDYTAVWTDNAGRVFYFDDSGCSCPIPFDGLTVRDLQVAHRPQDIITHLANRASNNYGGRRLDERASLVERVREVFSR